MKPVALPPFPEEPDTYTVYLGGSEGYSYTVMELTKSELRTLQTIQAKVAASETTSGSYTPVMKVYYGGVQNMARDSDYTLWQPKGQEVPQPKRERVRR